MKDKRTYFNYWSDKKGGVVYGHPDNELKKSEIENDIWIKNGETNWIVRDENNKIKKLLYIDQKYFGNDYYVIIEDFKTGKKQDLKEFKDINSALNYAKDYMKSNRERDIVKLSNSDYKDFTMVRQHQRSVPSGTTSVRQHSRRLNGRDLV